MCSAVYRQARHFALTNTFGVWDDGGQRNRICHLCTGKLLLPVPSLSQQVRYNWFKNERSIFNSANFLSLKYLFRDAPNRTYNFVLEVFYVFCYLLPKVTSKSNIFAVLIEVKPITFYSFNLITRLPTNKDIICNFIPCASSTSTLLVDVELIQGSVFEGR